MPAAMESVPIWMMVVGFLLVLGPLVTLHELGHYLVGRWCGVKADVFSVGFGGELAGYTDKKGTRWRLAAIPLGGYVQFAGDMNPSSQPSEEWAKLPDWEREQAFHSKKLWQRALIVAAGPVTNLLIGLVIFAAFAMAFGKPVTPPVVEAFGKKSSAETAGLEIGDRILSVDGEAVETFEELRLMILPYPGRTVDISLEREGQVQNIDVTIGTVEVQDSIGKRGRIGQLGVGSFSAEFVPAGLIESLVYGWDRCIELFGLIITGIGQIVTGERSVEELGGPLAIAGSSGERLSMGWLPFIEFIAFVSINLAFINLLPIPVLDGGHLAFYAAEAVRRKPASQRSQEWAFRTGLAFVLALMLFVTLIDIASLPVFR